MSVFVYKCANVRAEMAQWCCLRTHKKTRKRMIQASFIYVTLVLTFFCSSVVNVFVSVFSLYNFFFLLLFAYS